jgi:CubicO group peptidase (beta-lactamase class C family)
MAGLAQKEKITIKNQLSMTTGLDDDVPDFFCTTPGCLTFKVGAGTRCAYHNGPYTLLQDVVESASGINFNLYMNPRLKVPTGMDGLFVSVGFNSTYFSKPRSMTRFGLLMLNNGNWNGTQLMNDMTYFNDMITPSQTVNNSYGYLWWLNGQSSFMVPASQLVFPNMIMPSAPVDVFAALGKMDKY